MKKYVEEYRNSLKYPEAEEVVDLTFFRPIAFILVKCIYRLPITPNQISLLSVAFGLVSAWFFAIGKADYFRIGALLLLGANLLDCMDGQLARLQRSGTFFGRIVDGVADYVTGLAVFIALGIGIKSDAIWILVVGAGVSSVLHGMAFDYYQGEFLKVRTGQGNITADDVMKYYKHNINDQAGRSSRELLGRIYLIYLNMQGKGITLFTAPNYQMDEFQGNDSRMIRLWSFLGPSTNRSLLIIFCFIGVPLYYLFVVILGGNIWFGICLLRQSVITNYSRNHK
jgi:hypothetical protein